jgi:hypothetical protein
MQELDPMGGIAIKPILKPISYVLAALYLCMDFIFAE